MTAGEMQNNPHFSDRSHKRSVHTAHRISDKTHAHNYSCACMETANNSWYMCSALFGKGSARCSCPGRITSLLPLQSDVIDTHVREPHALV